jgi:tRNA(Arg) A34 adenosine deaminase TadA
MTVVDFDRAWRSLDPAFRRSLDLAWASLVSRGLAVGSVLTDADGRIVAEGRNRAYDPPGGADVLQGTPLAHAEMNVLADVGTERALDTCTLWTTHEPCSMCTAACAFTGVGLVRFMAPDPWAIAAGAASGADDVGLRVEGPADDPWLISANVLFMLSIAIPHGLDHPTVVRNREVEPEATGIVIDLLDAGLVGDLTDDQPADGFLSDVWPTVVEAAARRSARQGI